MIADTRRLVETETPSSDHTAVAQGARDIVDLLNERIGAEPETIVIDGVTHVRVRFGALAPKVVLLTHQDTVWPRGTLDRIPFSAQNGLLRGPGVFDMLTGLVMSIHATSILAETGQNLEGLSILITGDEEVGSTTSSQLILEETAEAEAVLVLEAAAEGALKVARKGTSIYQVEVKGKAAHAGLEPEKGVNAGVALGMLLPQIAALAKPTLGTTVTPTVFSGGSTQNTVPDRGKVAVDVRAVTIAEQERVDQALHSLNSDVPGAAVTVHGGINRPPMPCSAAQDLFERAVSVADELGVDRPESAEVGGGSDGNFTAGAGIPTLDGMGAAGDGAHAEHEHVIIAQIPPRTALLAGMIRSVLGGSE
ncbi:M20/M25/M40 family metallo-hydrolase [Nesterenkonia populi]|uniref:M20/M25/M40 family metallo-hydrolase n=1 Tax=Nesterenkonia populi TaxID=1591087 RepID=UPI001FE2BA58|nr:M20/M25/M40 family metallo-hydrolase [Nesterenkonia populi]